MPKQEYRKQKSFGIPTSKKIDSFLAKRKKEEERQKLDEEAAATLYDEFVSEFQPPVSFEDKNKTKKYNNSSIHEIAPPHANKTTHTRAHNTKSNLELLNEELKRDHEQRELKESLLKGEISINDPILLAALSNKSFEPHNDDDSISSSLYVGNLPLNATEKSICDIFLPFGSIGSIRIIRPQNEDKKQLCAFVTFMCKPDAETAFKELRENSTTNNIFVGWAKFSSFPPVPLYLSDNFSFPATLSGLPFCAIPYNITTFNGNFYNTKVFVFFPRDWTIMKLINRFVEFVIREGPLFEAFIMNRELNNPKFRFLFDPFIPENSYYRWRLFSILQGDSPYKWSEKEFRMFKGGSIWVPPRMPPGYNVTTKIAQPVLTPTISEQNNAKSVDKFLNDKQRNLLEHLLRHVTAERKYVAKVMVWALDHSEYAKEIVDVIHESLTIKTTPLDIKIARLYVLNDILHNISVDKPGAKNFRRYIEKHLPSIFEEFHGVLRGCERKISTEKIKKYIIPCFNAWQKWLLFQPDFINKLRDMFLGLKNTFENCDDDIDGVPLSTSEIISIESKISLKRSEIEASDEDIDGVPLLPTEYQNIMNKRFKY